MPANLLKCGTNAANSGEQVYECEFTLFGLIDKQWDHQLFQSRNNVSRRHTLTGFPASYSAGIYCEQPCQVNLRMQSACSFQVAMNGILVRGCA